MSLLKRNLPKIWERCILLGDVNENVFYKQSIKLLATADTFTS